jgi:hypothetical protein
MSDKVLDEFHLRRQLHHDIELLGETASQQALAEMVKTIAQQYKADLILAGLRRYLDTSSSQLRGGLGRLATLLPHEETTSMLRQEAANRRNPTQTRLTAALILERFLEAEVPPALMSDLKDPEMVVMQSLQEAVTEGTQNPYVLLEYVRQMRQENEETAFMVLGLLDQLPPQDRVELLRLIAFDPRERVAEAAISRLAGLRLEPDVVQQAGLSLHTLSANLGPDHQKLADRALRKMRFGGVTVQIDPPDQWRGLMTPCSYDGTQALWFLHPGQPGQADGTLIGLRVNWMLGIMETFGSIDVEKQYLPTRRKVGEVIPIALTDNTPTIFLESPLAYARQQLIQSLDVHWSAPKYRPLPNEYTLYSHHLFRFDPGQADPNLAQLLASGAEMWAGEKEHLAEIAAELMRNPIMSSWFLQDAHMESYMNDLPASPASPQVGQAIESWLQALARAVDQAALQTQLRRALEAQAGWLFIAGYRATARHAVLLAESMERLPINHHPLIQLMAETGMMLLLNRRASRRYRSR